MGLDIRTKSRTHRLNWGGVRDFEKWSKETLGVSPFPNWDGGNGTTVVFGKNLKNEREVKGDIKDVEKWIYAFTKWQLEGDNYLWEDDWIYYEALEWYWILMSALDCCYISYF
jgi:hypothetical protein